MTTTIISNNPPYSYGVMTNQAVSRLIALQTTIERLGDAIATASSNYQGTPGTEFEIAPPTPIGPAMQNLFGVAPGAMAGEQGLAYSYAMSRLHEAWQTFWAEAEPFIEQLDNGTTTP